MIIKKGEKAPEHQHIWGKGYMRDNYEHAPRYILMYFCKECKIRKAYDLTAFKPE